MSSARPTLSFSAALLYSGRWCDASSGKDGDDDDADVRGPFIRSSYVPNTLYAPYLIFKVLYSFYSRVK